MIRGRRGALLAISLAVLAPAGCGRRKAGVSLPAAPRVSIGMTEEGMASWYGHPYHGRPTTSGEIYDMEKLTAAHRTLPLGARVRVENLSNGRTVEVRINDRGPFDKDRIIDLSHAAARRIAMIGPGTARVRLTVIGLPETPSPGFYAVQVGSFQSRGNAERLRSRMAREHGAAVIRSYESGRGLFYRVLVGHESDWNAANALVEKLRRENFTPLVIRIDELPANAGL